jgi:hypothetical protein
MVLGETSALEARRRRAERRERRRPSLPPALLPAALLAASLLLIVCGALAYRRGPGWLGSLLRGRPPGIIIHHSATPAVIDGRLVTAAMIDQAHAGRGWGRSDEAGHVYHIGYHYVVLADGTVQPGRPERMPGAHCDGHNDMLGICLVGDFTRARPPAAQLRAAEELTRRLMRKYNLPPSRVYRHRDLDSTECPGDTFPWGEFRRELMSDD